LITSGRYGADFRACGILAHWQIAFGSLERVLLEPASGGSVLANPRTIEVASIIRRCNLNRILLTIFAGAEQKDE
jgi:FAD/FMN-containing dehydrogenase